MAATTDLFRRAGDDAVELSVHAQPGAGRSQVAGRHGTALKVRVAAPPERGRANEAVGDLLATTFGLPRRSVVLVAGETSRSKRFRLEGVDPDTFAVRLAAVLDEASRVR